MCDKRNFSKQEAEYILKKNKKSSKQYRKECRDYYCEYCNSWHLTSEEKKTVEEQIHLSLLGKWKKILKKQKRELHTI